MEGSVRQKNWLKAETVRKKVSIGQMDTIKSRNCPIEVLYWTNG
jgi:hypothetical protein